MGYYIPASSEISDFSFKDYYSIITDFKSFTYLLRIITIVKIYRVYILKMIRVKPTGKPYSYESYKCKQG